MWYSSNDITTNDITTHLLRSTNNIHYIIMPLTCSKKQQQQENIFKSITLYDTVFNNQQQTIYEIRNNNVNGNRNNSLSNIKYVIY